MKFRLPKTVAEYIREHNLSHEVREAILNVHREHIERQTERNNAHLLSGC